MRREGTWNVAAFGPGDEDDEEGSGDSSPDSDPYPSDGYWDKNAEENEDDGDVGSDEGWLDE